MNPIETFARACESYAETLRTYGSTNSDYFAPAGACEEAAETARQLNDWNLEAVQESVSNRFMPVIAAACEVYARHPTLSTPEIMFLKDVEHSFTKIKRDDLIIKAFETYAMKTTL